MIALLVASIVTAGVGHAPLRPLAAVVADSAVAPPAGDDPATTALATVLVAQAQSGTIDRTLFNARMNAALTSTLLASVSQQLAPFGKPVSVTFASRGIAHGFPSYRYRVVWPSRSVDETIALDRDGKVAGWLFRPSESSDPPPSAAPSPAR